MKVNAIQSCHLGPEISPEQFIPQHFFIYLLKGSMKVYDGDRHYTIKPGEYYIARKNHFVRYTKHREGNAFQKIIITLDEPFLQKFLERHPQAVVAGDTNESFFYLQENKLLQNYIRSLEPYYFGDAELDAIFSNIKREELVLIMLKSAPELAGILFNFNAPQKIDLEAFMHRNFRFNVSLERFAFMTGRSLSSFKRDFIRAFGTTPGQWLKKKRLEEAYFRISRQHQRPVDVYLDVGFEDLSHFSFAFKKEFGKSPAELATSV